MRVTARIRVRERVWVREPEPAEDGREHARAAELALRLPLRHAAEATAPHEHGGVPVHLREDEGHMHSRVRVRVRDGVLGSTEVLPSSRAGGRAMLRGGC